MRAFVALMLAALAAPAHGQAFVAYTWEWVTIEAGTSNVIPPAVLGKVSPGEGVEFRASLEFGPPVGTIHKPHGPVMGLARLHADFNAGSNHGGTFHAQVGRHPLFGPGPQIEANRIHNIRLGQEAINGQPLAHMVNSFENAIVVRWTPDHYTPRLVDFELVQSTAAAWTAELWTLDALPYHYSPVHYRIDGPVGGGSVQIPVVPSPAGFGVLATALLLAGSRRRERD